MGIHWRFVLLLCLVSALLPLSAMLLIRGISGGKPVAVLGGAILGAAGLFGLVALARLVVVVERRRGAR